MKYSLEPVTKPSGSSGFPGRGKRGARFCATLLACAAMLLSFICLTGCGPETSNPASPNSPDGSQSTKNETGEESIAEGAREHSSEASGVNSGASGATHSEADSELGSSETGQKRSEWRLRILAWNVESEGSDPEVIAQQLRAMGHYDVYGLSEVLPQAAQQFTAAPEGNYQAIVTRSGYNDRLQIIYDADRFELVRRLELSEIDNDRHRAPLVAHLRDRNSGREFMVMVNHLARGDADFRTKQAKLLVEWARNQTLPIVAVGDYNFDYVFATGTGNEGFKAMLRDNIFHWVRPVEWIDSNWFDPEPDGKDNFPGSLLDFVFLAGPATEWHAECRILVREGDFPDDERTSDHRPVEVILAVPDGMGDA